MARYSYEIWDMETRNLVDAFASEAEALQAVREAYARHGESYVLAWALAHATQRQMTSLGEGKALVQLAFAGSSARLGMSGAAG